MASDTTATAPSARAMERAEDLLTSDLGAEPCGHSYSVEPGHVTLCITTRVARLLDELDAEKRVRREAILALSDDVCERHDSVDGQLDPPDEEECWQCIIEKRDRELDTLADAANGMLDRWITRNEKKDRRITALEAQLDAVTKERDTAREQYQILRQSLAQVDKDYDALMRERDRYRAAIEWALSEYPLSLSHMAELRTRARLEGE